MKRAVLSVLTSGVAAQVTIGPIIAPGVLNVAAVDPADPGYKTCSQAINLFEGCIESLGGVEAAADAEPTELINCACCDGNNAAAPLYSVCSDYLEEEVPTASTQYEAYSTLYRACALGATCTGGSGNTRPKTTAAVSRDSDDDDDESTTRGAVTTSPASQTYALACENMLGVFASCTRANSDFTRLPFKEQAECYCCRGSGDKLTWTDEMGGYAKTCASWASTGEPDTILGVAETFASFCKRFTTACDVAATRTKDSETTPTDDDDDDSNTDDADSTTESSPRQTANDDDDDDNSDDATTSDEGPVTVTVGGATGTDASATETGDSGNAASSLRVGLGAALAAVAALAVAL